MKVLGKNVLVKRESGELTSTGGLILTSSLEPYYGRVLCVGCDVSEVSVGELPSHTTELPLIVTAGLGTTLLVILTAADLLIHLFISVTCK